ncbi:PAS domain S-box protein [Candidatus Latescibacterota bacterium]
MKGEKLLTNLNETGKQLKQILDCFPVPIVWMNTNNEFIFMNEAFTVLFGYTIVEIPDTKHWFTSAYPDEKYRSERIETWNDINREAKRNPNFKIPRQIINITCKNGSILTIEMYGVCREREFLLVFIDITERIDTEREQKQIIKEFKEIASGIKMLSGLLPICSHCKKIRSSEGYWEQLEEYIRAHSDAKFTHGICPDCMKKLYQEFDF